MPETAIASAFARAGFNTAISKLYMVALDLLRRGGRNPHIAHESFCEAFLRDPKLMAEIAAEELNIGERDWRDAGLRYLKRCTADMTHKAPAKAVEPKQMDGGDQGNTEAQPSHVASPSTPLPGEGQYQRDAQT